MHFNLSMLPTRINHLQTTKKFGVQERKWQPLWKIILKKMKIFFAKINKISLKKIFVLVILLKYIQETMSRFRKVDELFPDKISDFSICDVTGASRMTIKQHNAWYFFGHCINLLFCFQMVLVRICLLPFVYDIYCIKYSISLYMIDAVYRFENAP